MTAPRYDIYHFTKKEKVVLILKGMLMVFLLAGLFYDSLLAAIPLSVLLVFLFRKEREKRKKQQLDRLNQEFRDGILAVSAALGAGYSVENAFGEALKDLKLLYGNECPVIREFQILAGGMAVNRTLEELLYAFARRSGLEDVQMFAEVFAICKRTGGDLQGLIQDTASRIGQKLDVHREIQTILSAKKFEQKIMNLTPIGILAYVKWTSPAFLEGLYGSLPGILIMSLCLFVYGGAYLLSERLTRIEV